PDEPPRIPPRRFRHRRIPLAGRIRREFPRRAEHRLRHAVSIHPGDDRLDIHPVFAIAEERGAVVTVKIDDHSGAARLLLLSVHFGMKSIGLLIALWGCAAAADRNTIVQDPAVAKVFKDRYLALTD